MPKTRRSDQREMIRAEVHARTDHPTAEAVYTALHTKAPNLSLGTVYRNLNLLADQGIIRRVPIPGQPDHFDFNTNPFHCHFCCRSCGAVVDMDPANLPELLPRQAKQQGYRIDGYDMVYSGLCPQCAQAPLDKQS